MWISTRAVLRKLSPSAFGGSTVISRGSAESWVCSPRLGRRRRNSGSVGLSSCALIPSEQEYFNLYGLTPEKLALAANDAIVMHPGPMNRGLEIDSAVADGAHSVILPQVTNGIAVRMAIMALILGGPSERNDARAATGRGGA